jgi:transposase
MSLSEQQRAELVSCVGTGGYDGSVESRAQLVLWYDEGYSKADIVRMSGTTPPTLDKWLKRYEEFGLEGLVSRTSPGSPPQIPTRIRARVLALTRQSPPEHLGISHWTSPQMARYIKLTEGVYVSQTWVSRLWRTHGLQPWRQGTFKISQDPEFDEKVRDVVGLYRDPPEGEGVVSVDVKPQVQALDRTQPMLPVDFGKTAKRTHDYVRNGTTDLYACQDIRTGKVTINLSSTHNTHDFLTLMDRVVKARTEKKIHVILDNASVHTSDDTNKWLAKHHGRVVFHFTPTGASWLNMIEIWNGVITRQLIRRGTFASVKVLDTKIRQFADNWNSYCKPVAWKATADEIIEKVRRVTAQLNKLLRATQISDVIMDAA